jgi:hypothetical protein
LSNTLGEEVVVRTRITLLPILTVLFLVSYGLLTMLVVEQSRTIDSQRGLIQDLFQDSIQLSTLKGKAVQKQYADAQAQAKSHPQSKTPPQAVPKAEMRNRSTSKSRRPLPQKPPRDTAGEGDERRMLISI